MLHVITHVSHQIPLACARGGGARRLQQTGSNAAKTRAKKAPAFLLLYNVENPTTEGLMVFRIHNAADTPYEFMVKTKYPEPKGDYISYILESDAITFGDIDIQKLLTDFQAKNPKYIKGEPIYYKGSEVQIYRKN